MLHLFQVEPIPDDQRSDIADSDDRDTKICQTTRSPWTRYDQRPRVGSTIEGDNSSHNALQFTRIPDDQRSEKGDPDDSACNYPPLAHSDQVLPIASTKPHLASPRNFTTPIPAGRTFTPSVPHLVTPPNRARSTSVSSTATSATIRSPGTSSSTDTAAIETKNTTATCNQSSSPRQVQVAHRVRVFSSPGDAGHDLEVRIAGMHRDAVVLHAGGRPLKAEELHALFNPTGWLYDTTVEAYLTIAARQHNELASSALAPAPTRQAAATTPEFVILNQHDIFTVSNAASFLSEMWGSPKFSTLEAILVPICLHDHWTLGIIRPKDKKLQVVNSYPSINSELFAILHNMLSAILKQYDAMEWEESQPESARQHNGYDCALFVITNAELIMARKDLALCDASRMTAKRREVAMRLFQYPDPVSSGSLERR